MGVGCERSAKQRSRLAAGAGGGPDVGRVGAGARGSERREQGVGGMRRSFTGVFETFPCLQRAAGWWERGGCWAGWLAGRWVTWHLSAGSSAGQGRRSSGVLLTLHVWHSSWAADLGDRANVLS